MENEAGVLERLESRVAHYRFRIRLGEQGRVASVGDGVAWVYGLPSAAAEEIVRFEDGSRGLVFDLQAGRLGVILMDPAAQVASASLVSHTGERLEIGVGDALLGRVIDPLGKPLDGLPPPELDGVCALEASSPPIIARDSVSRPLYTGIKVIDSLIPIGRGQRQLIIGDAGTGKTSLALDTIIGQAGQQVTCVYVSIGQKRSETALVLDLLRRYGALAYTTVVVAEATATPGMKYLAPFTGCAVAEGRMRRGHDTLVVYDDLTTHARAYRELSLLMHRPPGREAYPGDIFYLHARLLERSTRLAADHGGGSLTALPVVETEEGEIAAYIPTNLISITDGQIYLEPELFFAGVRPAINVGISVSRVGGNAQVKAMKKIAGSLRLDLAAYRELEAFAQLGTELDKTTQKQLDRGARMVELLKQPQYVPYHVVDQIISIFAGTRGFLDDVAVSHVAEFEKALLNYFQTVGRPVWNELDRKKDLDAALEKKLEQAIRDFKSTWKPPA